MSHEEFEDLSFDELDVKKRRGKISRMVQITEDTYSFEIQLDVHMRYYPGQYVLVDYDLEGKKISRAYTMTSSSINQNVIEFNIQRTDDPVTSHIITQKEVGDYFEFRGPYGRFVYHDGIKAKTLVMISVDIGVNTFISMINYIWDKELDLTIRLYHQGNKRLLADIWELSLMFDLSIEFLDELDINLMDLEADLIYICGEKKITNPLLEKLQDKKKIIRLEQWF